MTELIVSSSEYGYDENKTLDFSTGISWKIQNLIDVNFSLPLQKNKNPLSTVVGLGYEHGSFKSFLISTGIGYDSLDELNTSLNSIKTGTQSNIRNNTGYRYDSLDELNTPVLGVRSGTSPVDSDGNYNFRLVDLRYEKPNPDLEFRYLPTTDFVITSELISFTGNFVQPLDLTTIKTRMSPVDSGSEYPWSRTRIVDIYQELNYGYSINNFIVGGSVRTDYPVDEDAINPPVDPPTSIGVIKLVNVINVVKLPERTPIDFVDFTLATDLSSISWVVNFTIGSQASLDLLKPSGLNTIDVEININGELFVCFIGRTKTNFSTISGGGLKKSWKCTGWSYSKLLSYPYAPKKSYTDTSQTSPSSILNSELTSLGFTGNWASVNWTIPANVYSYSDKAPLAAIMDVVNSVGAVVIPSPNLKEVTVKPYYPVSPWDWGLSTPDFNMNETEFFSMDTEWLPKEAADSIFVYGEETGGVAVKCVRNGTAGLVTLPTIVDKYITDTIAGTERGRIEIAKNGFKEIIPVTTYVDANDGILKPQSLLSITPLSGVTWKGMVIGTSISIKRQGTAVLQQLQIERYYE